MLEPAEPIDEAKQRERRASEDAQTIILMISWIMVVAGLSTNIGLSIIGVALFFAAVYARSN